MEVCSLARAFWELYFQAVTEEDAEQLLDFIDPAVKLVGTGAHEVYESRDEFVKDLYKAVHEHQELIFSIRNFTAGEVYLDENIRLVCGRLDISGAARGSHSGVDMDTRYSMVYRRTEDGWRIVHIHHSVPFLEQDTGEYYPRSLYRQLEETRTLADAMAELASKDSLTGLYNLRTLDELYNQFVSQNAWLILGDLDNFKKVNDICGHVKGNDILKQIAGVLRSSVRANDVVSRIGGDEFVLLCGNMEKSSVEHLLQRILDRLSGLRFRIPFEVGMSLGAIRIHQGESLNNAIRRADAQMYAAKGSGKNCYCICGTCSIQNDPETRQGER